MPMYLDQSDPQFAIDQQERSNIFQRDAISARFFKKAVYDKDASEGFLDIEWDPERRRDVRVRKPGAGRPIYREEIFITLGIPGDTAEQRSRPMREADKFRFKPEWEAFEKGETAPALGTPLDELPFLGMVQREEFKHMGVKTAEQLAAMSDVNGQKFMGFQQLRRRVQDYLAAAAGEAPLNDMRKELESRDAQIAAMQKQLEELSARLPKVETAEVEEQ
ncbi:MAG TPA: hypothetical protein VF994_00110 [Myxococcales bacterium]